MIDIYKKNLPHQHKKVFFVYSINMPNLEQNNEIEHIYKEINLLQDLLKKNAKNLNQFQNGLIQIGRIRVKKDKRQIFLEPKKYKI